MTSPTPLTSTSLVTRSSIDTRPYDHISSHRPTPASSSPNLSPSSANASLLKQYDRSCPGHSLSPCDRNIPSLSPRDRPNHSLTVASDRPTASSSQDLGQSFSLRDRTFSGSDFGPCDRPTHGPSDRPNQHSPLPKCKTLSLRRESGKRSACLHLSKKAIRLVRSGRTMQRYDLAFLWGLWLIVAVQNVIRYSPQGMPSAERSCILSSPTQPAGATA